MSKRRKRAEGHPRHAAAEARGGAQSKRDGESVAAPAERDSRPGGPPTGSGRAPQGGLQLGLGAQIALLIALFAVVTGIADLAGAASLGVAAGIGQIAFALGLVALLLRAP